MQYIREMNDPLSGTTDIKIAVKGMNKTLVQKLVDNLQIVVKKRKLKSLRIKSISGYIDKDTFIMGSGNFYDTFLEVVLSNKDILVGEYKSSNHSLLVKINNVIVFDLNSKFFDKELLVDKMINEYVKYLKENKFSINESNPHKRRARLGDILFYIGKDDKEYYGRRVKIHQIIPDDLDHYVGIFSDGTQVIADEDSFSRTRPDKKESEEDIKTRIRWYKKGKLE